MNTGEYGSFVSSDLPLSHIIKRKSSPFMEHRQPQGGDWKHHRLKQHHNTRSKYLTPLPKYQERRRNFFPFRTRCSTAILMTGFLDESRNHFFHFHHICTRNQTNRSQKCSNCTNKPTGRTTGGPRITSTNTPQTIQPITQPPTTLLTSLAHLDPRSRIGLGTIAAITQTNSTAPTTEPYHHPTAGRNKTR